MIARLRDLFGDAPLLAKRNAALDPAGGQRHVAASRSETRATV